MSIIDDMSTMIAIDVAYSAHAHVGVIKLLPVSRTTVDTTARSYRLIVSHETYSIISEEDETTLAILDV